jgi:CheY-like chemotaxis protein
MELKKILYVDDEPDVRHIVLLSLGSIGGYQVQAYECGTAAIEAAENFAPDLLLLDVMMPGLTGPETLARLRELNITADTPAIFLTAKAQTHEVEKLKQNEGADVVAKPFDIMALPETIHGAWSRLSNPS